MCRRSLWAITQTMQTCERLAADATSRAYTPAHKYEKDLLLMSNLCAQVLHLSLLHSLKACLLAVVTEPRKSTSRTT